MPNPDADTLFGWLLTMQTPCQHSRRLCVHTLITNIFSKTFLPVHMGPSPPGLSFLFIYLFFINCNLIKLCQTIIYRRPWSDGSGKIFYIDGSRSATLIDIFLNGSILCSRAVDPDPHGSAFILPPGSGSTFNMRIRIQEGKI